MIDSTLFVTGIGVLVALDTVSIALTFEAYRQALADEEARQSAAEAEEQAQYAHTRLTRHLSRDHAEAVRAAAKAEREARRESRAD
jgi:hypothetical protein